MTLFRRFPDFPMTDPPISQYDLSMQDFEKLEKKLDELDAEIAEETKGIAARYDADAGRFEKVAIAPRRGQITVQFVALGWRPQ